MRFSQNTKYKGVVWASLLLSLGGIFLAATKNPADGGRGGAIAVALSFYILFARESYGFSAYKVLIRDLNADDYSLEALKTRVRAIQARLNIEADGQTIQNKALAWSSCVGTIAWGFGDCIAQSIKSLLSATS